MKFGFQNPYIYLLSLFVSGTVLINYVLQIKLTFNYTRQVQTENILPVKNNKF